MFRKWKGKFLVFGVIVGCTLVLQAKYTSAQIPGEPPPNANVQREELRLERHYETLLNNEISNYYPSRSFLVDVQVVLEKVRIPSSYKRMREREEPLGIDQLPGLPVLPEEMTRKVKYDTVKADKFTNALQIANISTRIIVDTSYTDSEVDFLRELAISEGNFNEFRGDQVRIQRKPFPQMADRALEQKAEKEKIATERKEEASAWDFSRFSTFEWLIISVLILLFLVILAMALWINRLRKIEEVDSQNDSAAMNELKAEIENLKNNGTSGKTNKLPKQDLANYERDKTYITNQLISNPQKVSQLLENWMVSDANNGPIQAAQAIQASNPRLLNALRPSMSRENYELLKNTIDDSKELSEREKVETARNFKRALQEILEEEGDPGNGHDMFEFMNQLTDDQLLHLFKEETNKMIAIAMAQLDSSRAARMLQSIDEDRRTSILVEMGKIHDLSIDTYKEVANYFSEKALRIINMKYVIADGVKSILNLIDSLPVDKQEQYVQSITENDLEMARRIREHFVAFSDLPDLENQVLQEALDDFETETIITALIGAEQAIVDKVLEVRPQREQKLIRFEIENRPDAKEQEIDEARKKLLGRIRKSIKRG